MVRHETSTPVSAFIAGIYGAIALPIYFFIVWIFLNTSFSPGGPNLPVWVFYNVVVGFITGATIQVAFRAFKVS